LEEEIRDILANYYRISDIHKIHNLSDGFANLNYKIETDSASFVYRICLQRSNVEELKYEVGLSKALENVNFSIARLFANTKGEYITYSPAGMVMLSEFVEGNQPELKHSTIKEIAISLAELNLFEDWELFERKNIIHIDYCPQIIEEFKTASQQFPEIYSYFEEQTKFLEEPLKIDLPKGLIHGDVFPDNTIYKNDKLIAVIDFEEACVDHLLMEVGMTINGFCFRNNDLDEDLAFCFLKHYHQVRPLNDLEWELLPYYIQWAAHGMLSWHLRCQLMYKNEKRQYERVVELMNRVKILRKKTSFNFKNKIVS